MSFMLAFILSRVPIKLSKIQLIQRREQVYLSYLKPLKLTVSHNSKKLEDEKPASHQLNNKHH